MNEVTSQRVPHETRAARSERVFETERFRNELVPCEQSLRKTHTALYSAPLKLVNSKRRA